MTAAMKTLPIALLCSLLLVAPAHAQAPVAVVEDVAAKSAGVEFMDYVPAGKVIRLGPDGTMVLGYLKSCWRETIRGGTVTVGTAQSEVAGGAVDRMRIDCDGGRMELAAAQSKQSAAAVFRKVAPVNAVPKPQFTIYGRTPVIELKGGGKVVIQRVDVANGERMEFTIGRMELVRGAFYDLLRAGTSLHPGGIYRATVTDQLIIFEVDKAAKAGAEPVASRLLRFQPSS
jgi:hypothetical protein